MLSVGQNAAGFCLPSLVLVSRAAVDSSLNPRPLGWVAGPIRPLIGLGRAAHLCPRALRSEGGAGPGAHLSEDSFCECCGRLVFDGISAQLHIPTQPTCSETPGFVAFSRCPKPSSGHSVSPLLWC